MSVKKLRGIVKVSKYQITYLLLLCHGALLLSKIIITTPMSTAVTR